MGLSYNDLRTRAQTLVVKSSDDDNVFAGPVRIMWVGVTAGSGANATMQVVDGTTAAGGTNEIRVNAAVALTSNEMSLGPTGVRFSTAVSVIIDPGTAVGYFTYIAE